MYMYLVWNAYLVFVFYFLGKLFEKRTILIDI